MKTEKMYMPTLIVRDVSVIDSNGRKYSPDDLDDHGITGIMLVFRDMSSAKAFFPSDAIESTDVKEIHATGQTFRM